MFNRDILLGAEVKETIFVSKKIRKLYLQYCNLKNWNEVY